MKESFPFEKASRLLLKGKEDVSEFVCFSRRVYDNLVRAERQIRDLELQVLRLTHENDFMLKLVNSQHQGDCVCCVSPTKNPATSSDSPSTLTSPE